MVILFVLFGKRFSLFIHVVTEKLVFQISYQFNKLLLITFIQSAVAILVTQYVIVTCFGRHKPGFENMYIFGH